jgi:putative redox protein
MTTDPAGAAAENTRTLVARWDGGMRCIVETGRFELVVDEPASAGGTDTGPEPTHYFLASLASCYALALVWAANKRGITMPDLSVTGTGTYDGPRFSHLRLRVTTTLPREQLDPLLPVASRVCYVTNTIKTSPPVEIEVTGAP